MFWTAFLWGVGVSCGASVGILLLLVMWSLLNWFVGTASKATGINEKSLEALIRRNELSEEQVEQMRFLVTAAERIADKCD